MAPTLDELGAYLSSVYGLMADLVEDQTSLAASENAAQDLADLWRDLGVVFDDLEPPTEAASFHTRWQEVAGSMVEISDEFAKAPTDPAAAAAFLEAIGDLTEDLTELDQTQIGLAISVFAARGDDLAAYLGQVLDLQRKAAPISEQLFGSLSELSTDPEGAARRIFASGDDLAVIGDQWETFDPPPKVADLHRRQVDLMRRIVEVFGELAEAVEANVDPRPSLLTELNELGALSPAQNAEWSRLIGDALLGE